MTEAEKKAWGAKMKELRDRKKEEEKQEVKEEVEETISNEDYNSLKRQVEELKKLIETKEVKEGPQMSTGNPQMSTGNPQITASGLIGTLNKFNTDPAYYPDPSERLAKEPRLARFAFGENWELEFSVKTSSYTTLDNRRVAEPQFTVQLIGVVFDDNGEKTDGRYVRRQMIFFEDPDAALSVARENGLKVEDFEEKAFLDEMRYLRVKNWLLEAFYSPVNTNKKQNKKQMVIGNQVVDYYEISSVESSPMPFNNLSTTIK